MPETAMNKNSEPVLCEDEIRGARQIPAMQTETQTQPMRSAAHRYFGCGMARPDPRHDLAAPLAIDNIRQSQAPISCPIPKDDSRKVSRRAPKENLSCIKCHGITRLYMRCGQMDAGYMPWLPSRRAKGAQTSQGLFAAPQAERQHWQGRIRLDSSAIA